VTGYFICFEKNLEKYRSVSLKPRKIKCVETGQIFDSARKASEWVEFVLEINYCDFNLIKVACRRTNGMSYGSLTNLRINKKQ